MEKLTAKQLRACLNWFIELATCPICLQTLTPDTALCVNGHAVCASHQPDLQNCPICREQYSNVRPSGLVQQLVLALPHPCRFEGCTYFVKSEDDHEQFCGWRPTQCKLCEWMGSVKAILTHVRAEHNDTLLEQRQTFSTPPLNPKVECSVFFPIIVDGYFFWGEMKNDPQNSKLTAIVHFVAKEKTLSVFSAKVMLRKKERKGKKIFPCRKTKAPFSASIDLNLNSVADPYKDNCICIPSSNLHKYTNSDQKLIYRLYVKKEKWQSVRKIVKSKYESLKKQYFPKSRKDPHDPVGKLT